MAEIPKSPGQASPSENPLQDQQELAELLRSREIEPIEFLELSTLGFVEILEKAEGGREEEGSVQWPLSVHLQQLVTQGVAMKRSTSVLVNYGHAQEVPGKPGWYTKVPTSYGFDSESVRVKDGDAIRFEERVLLEGDTKREERAKRIDKFTRDVLARMKFAGLYGHMFKKSIESISNLATIYLGSVDIKPEDMEALVTLPASPEDSGKILKSVSGVEYPQDKALGRMMTTAWQIFNAVGLSEKPELFMQFISQSGWQKVVGAGDAALFREWFGNPTAWKSSANPETWTSGQTNVRTEKTWEGENRDGKRGSLTKWGNIFVREDSFEMPRDFRKEVAQYLGGSETAKQAVELGWKYFRLFAAADFVGYEWYLHEVKDDRGNVTGHELHAKIPLGGDVTADFGKAIHPEAYLEMYHKNSRGAVPRGEYGKIKPLAVDILRAMNFGDNYTLPNGMVLKDRPSLYDLLFVHGLQPDEINFNKLSDRALISPYLRFFMSSCGREYGDGSFDIMTDKIGSPDPYLSPAFWEKLKSKLHVGITKETVAWNNFMKSGANYRMPSPGEVEEYKLEMIRTFLDGLFAEEISVAWDTRAENRGAEAEVRILNKEAKGIPKVEKKARYASHRIIDAANEAISGLAYSYDRLIDVRKEFRIL